MKTFYLTFLLPLILSQLLAETITITGKVVGENNEPISGVNIYSGADGVVSQTDGAFSLDVDENSIVIFSHMGYNDVSFLPKTISDFVYMSTTIIDGKEIIVQAELGTKNLFNSPSSISILTKKELESRYENHFQNLIGMIPNLNYSSGTSRPRYFQIRGIGERSQYAGEGAPNFSVGYMVDGIDYSGIGMVGMLFDTKQIEVFKGPQSSIYGPNAMAGLINITSSEPTPYFTGISAISVGSDNQKTAGFAVGGPLSTKLLFRFAVQQHNQDGFRKNVYRNLNNTNRRLELFTRVKLNWSISPNVKLHIVSLNANLNNGYDAWATDNNKDFITQTDEQGMDLQQSDANSVKIHFKDFSDKDAFYQYTTSTNLLEHSYDGDWANNDYWREDPFNFNPESTFWEFTFYDKTIRNRNQETHEIRLSSDKYSSLSWIVGYYQSQMNESDDASGWLFGGDATLMSTNFDVINTSIYAQSSSKLFNHLSTIISIRTEDIFTKYFSSGFAIPEVSEEIQHTFSGAKLAVVYNLSNSMNVFTSMSRGYRAGGINQNPYLSKPSRFYDPEFNTNIEAGIKFVSDNFLSNITIFSMNRKNQQVQISNQQEEGNSISYYFYTSNAATGTNRGAEFDSKLKLISGLVLRMSCGILETHIDAYEFWTDDATKIILGDREQAMAPPYNFAIGMNYSHSFGLFADVEYTGKDGYYYSDSHNQKSDAYQLLHLKIGYSKNFWSLSVWGKNILDTRYTTRGFYFGNEPIWNEEKHTYPEKLYVSYGDPLEYGITLKYQF